MPRKDKKPWLGYSGQSAAEILACKTTHRIDSLLCALEEAIDLRQSRTPGHALTEEERTFLAAMALEREVNNGGFDQFFMNSSRQYAPIIVSALETIGCTEVAALARQAVGASGRPDREEVLNGLDQRFYALSGIAEKLFAFVESRPEAFAIEKMFVPPPPPKRGNTNLIKLGVQLMVSPALELTFESVRRLTAEAAARNEISASAEELDGASYLFLFQQFLKAGDLERAEFLAKPAFDLTREDTSHCLAHRRWVELLIERSKFALAEEATLQYLEYLKGDDTSIPFVWNRVTYWADLLREHRGKLPRAEAFYREHFPQIDLTAPPTPSRIIRIPRKK
jgi:Domain of unknown function (DUF4375)